MKPSRRTVHRCCLFAAVVLSVLIGVSMFVRVQLSPWTVLMCGEWRFESQPPRRIWFECWPMDHRVPWSERVGRSTGTFVPWVQRYVQSSFIMYIPWNSNTPLATAVMVRAPLLYPTLLLAGVAWWTYRYEVKPGHCRCGYDLTGNTSGVCPECGAVVAMVAESSTNPRRIGAKSRASDNS